MTTTAFRRIAFGAVPAMLVAGAVAGCGDSAPAVQAPPSTANSQASNGGGKSTDQGTDQPVPTESAVPTVSDTPSSSSATGDPAKICTTTEDTSFLTPGVLAPSTKKATWGKPLPLSQKYGGTVTITPQAPTAKKGQEGDIFGPKKGQTNLLVKITINYKSGDQSSISGMYFTLRDVKKNICEANSLTELVPKQDQFDEASVSKTTKSYTGTLVFEVPAGQDYKKYTLLYRPDTFDDKSSDAPVAWTG